MNSKLGVVIVLLVRRALLGSIQRTNHAPSGSHGTSFRSEDVGPAL
jgi:hypothetical protein